MMTTRDHIGETGDSGALEGTILLIIVLRVLSMEKKRKKHVNLLFENNQNHLKRLSHYEPFCKVPRD